MFRLPLGKEVELVYFETEDGQLLVRTPAELEIIGPPAGARRLEIPEAK